LSDGTDASNWTVESARSYLPRVRVLVEVIAKAVEASQRARGNGHSKPESTQSPLIGPREALEELEERGVIVRDPSRGLVDFPSRSGSGRTVLLCWQLGEEDLEWWHLPEDGFAGRRRLPVPPDV
jgi:hypothetical protein